jgi:hypothetical protein
MPKTKAENQNVPKERQKLPAKTKPKPSRKLTNPPNHSGLDGQDLVEVDGIEPTTSCLQSRRSPN